MPVYNAPVDEAAFLLRDVFRIDRYNNLPGFADATPDTVEAQWPEMRFNQNRWPPGGATIEI